MNAPILLLFLFGIHFIKGAVILRDGLGEFPLELLEEPTKLSSISINQNYENKFSSGVSSSSFASNGLPQYLHQGNNLFIKPQFQLSGSASPTIAAILIPLQNDKLIADCDKTSSTTEQPSKYEEPEKPNENHEDLASTPQLELDILNDSMEKETIVIPEPPELPPMDLPELPVPVDISNLDQPKKEDDDENIIKPVTGELLTSEEHSASEDSKPIEIPHPPELPSLPLPELPIKVIDQIPISGTPALTKPCEQSVEVISPTKPENEIHPEDEQLPSLTIPSVPVSTSNENIIINNESSKLENNIISFPEKHLPKPIFITVVPNYPQIPLALPQLPIPQFPSNAGIPSTPANVPPCPPQFPYGSLLQVPNYVNTLGPQYEVVPVPPYKK